jgi:hypothetical protein
MNRRHTHPAKIEWIKGYAASINPPNQTQPGEVPPA